MAIRNFLAKISGTSQRSKTDSAIDSAMGKTKPASTPAKANPPKPSGKPVAKRK